MTHSMPLAGRRSVPEGTGRRRRAFRSACKPSVDSHAVLRRCDASCKDEHGGTSTTDTSQTRGRYCRWYTPVQPSQQARQGRPIGVRRQPGTPHRRGTHAPVCLRRAARVPATPHIELSQSSDGHGARQHVDNDPVLTLLRDTGRRYALTRAEVFLCQGDAAACVCWVLDGRVLRSVVAEDGKERSCTRMRSRWRVTSSCAAYWHACRWRAGCGGEIESRKS
jgi:hypothetical protein